MEENLMTQTFRRGKYSLPTMDTMRASKYVVLPGQITEDYQNSKINTPVGSENIEGFLSDLTTTGAADQTVLLSLLRKMAQNERAKEVSFLVGLYNDPVFNSELEPLVEPLREAIEKAVSGTATSNDYTKIFTILESTEEGLKNVKNIISTYKNAQLDEKFKVALKKEIDRQGAELGVNYNKKTIIPDLDLDMTQIMYNAVESMRNTNFDLKNPDTNKAALENINLILKSQGFLPIGKTTQKDEHYITTLKDFIEFRGVKKKDGLQGKTVKQKITSSLSNVAKGIGAELVGTLSNQGIGAIGTKALTGFESINDIEASFTIEGNFSDKLQNSDLFNYDEFIKQLQMTENQIKAIKNKFKIAYSSKMYMPDVLSSQSKRWSLDRIARDYKIVGSSPVSAKAEQISNLAASTGIGDIENLLFMLNNTGTGALYENMKEDVSAALATIAATWMFGESEDIFMEAVDNFAQTNKTGSSTLHIFILNGVYMPVSNILYRLADELEDQNRELRQNAVKVTISDYNSLGFYKENIRQNENIIGLQRWNYLRDQVQQQTKITIELNRTLLSEFLQF